MRLLNGDAPLAANPDMPAAEIPMGDLQSDPSLDPVLGCN